MSSTWTSSMLDFYYNLSSSSPSSSLISLSTTTTTTSNNIYHFCPQQQLQLRRSRFDHSAHRRATSQYFILNDLHDGLFFYCHFEIIGHLLNLNYIFFMPDKNNQKIKLIVFISIFLFCFHHPLSNRFDHKIFPDLSI